MPNRASPRLALPRRVGLSRQPWTASPRGRGSSPRFDSLPCPASPGHAAPCPAQPGRAEPYLTTPDLTWPRWPISSALDDHPQGTGAEAPVSIPCHASPGPTSPRPASPCPTRPRPALPRGARPCPASLACLISPGRPAPGDGGRSPRFDSLPCPATPGLAEPSRATRCQAMPRQAEPRWPTSSALDSHPREPEPKPPFRLF